jgi:hypothetical protein
MKRRWITGGVSRALRVVAALSAILASHTPAFADTILFVGNLGPPNQKGNLGL